MFILASELKLLWFFERPIKKKTALTSCVNSLVSWNNCFFTLENTLYLPALTNANPSVFQMLFPGYSFDTAYVEFLNLEDAVHFMESNQVAHPRHSTTAANKKKAWAGEGEVAGFGVGMG